MDDGRAERVYGVGLVVIHEPVQFVHLLHLSHEA
jgi:hypothetical protein